MPLREMSFDAGPPSCFFLILEVQTEEYSFISQAEASAETITASRHTLLSCSLEVVTSSEAQVKSRGASRHQTKITVGSIGLLNRGGGSIIEDVENIRCNGDVLPQERIEVVFDVQIDLNARRVAKVGNEARVVIADGGRRRETALAGNTARAGTWVGASGAAKADVLRGVRDAWDLKELIAWATAEVL